MALASALPTEWLVIGVPVFIRQRVTIRVNRVPPDWTRIDPAAARRRWHLHRHARVAHIASVLAARRRRSQSCLFLRH